VEIRRIIVQGQPEQKGRKTPSQPQHKAGCGSRVYNPSSIGSTSKGQLARAKKKKSKILSQK
jgi:hypothetical protein